MKKIITTIAFASLFAACKESETITPQQPTPQQPSTAVAAFQTASANLKEADPNQLNVEIPLSKAAPIDGTLIVKIIATNSEHGVDFVTSPAAVNQEISLPVAKGATSIGFSIQPVQNNIVNYERSIQFTLDRASGGVSFTANSSYTLVIQDDDLVGKLKKYETVSGNWRELREFTYVDQGLVKGINWTSYTPFQVSGSYTYKHENGRIASMTDQAGFATNYFWEGNRVVKSEKYASQNLMQRIEYGYDDAGNVGEMVQYDRQPDGTIQRSMVFIFLYHQDGNIYKRIIYHVQEDQELALLSTQTFENYLMKPNPVAMVETLPHLNAQPNLPQSYRYELHDKIVEYQMQYRFRADGLLTQRTVTSGMGTTETTSYTYH
jgi:hypothetical protein